MNNLTAFAVLAYLAYSYFRSRRTDKIVASFMTVLEGFGAKGLDALRSPISDGLVTGSHPEFHAVNPDEIPSEVKEAVAASFTRGGGGVLMQEYEIKKVLENVTMDILSRSSYTATFADARTRAEKYVADMYAANDLPLSPALAAIIKPVNEVKFSGEQQPQGVPLQ